MVMWQMTCINQCLTVEMMMQFPIKLCLLKTPILTQMIGAYGKLFKHVDGRRHRVQLFCRTVQT